MVGDGDSDNPYVYLWQFQNGTFSEPNKLCLHRCSSHIQQTHVHPRFSPDGTYVIFTSDATGYGNVYKVAVAYVVVAWLLFQAASILLPTFEAPTLPLSLALSLRAPAGDGVSARIN